MFREMRRKKNKMSKEDTLTLLKNGREGVLGTYSDNGYPYTVVVNYAYKENKIYIHSAKEGHKITNIINHPNVSFTVFDNVKIIEEEFTTKYQSVTLFGKAKLVSPSKEVLMELIKKYSSNFIPSGKVYVDKSFETTQLIEIEIEHITGKERL